MDFASIWVILKVLKIGLESLKSPNAGGSGSDQNPDRKAREPSPDRANNTWELWERGCLGIEKVGVHDDVELLGEG